MENGIGSGSETDGNANASHAICHDSNIFLPVSIFNSDASGLESISLYLREKVGLRYCSIADLLNRDDRTIWGACKGAKEKFSGAFSDSKVQVPLSIFKDRSLSVLEALSEYLKEGLNMRYCKIALLLNKDQRTIWTAYSRAKKKRRKNAAAT